MLKKIMLLTAVIFAIGFAQAGEKIKIGMTVLDISNPFFVALTNAAKAKAAEYGAEILINDSKNKSDVQITAMENFIAAGCQAIIVTATDPVAVSSVAGPARADGVKIIAHTTKLEEYDAWVAASEYDMGYTLGLQAGEWAKNHIKGQVEVGLLNFDIIPQVIQRKQGIIDGIKKFVPDMKIVGDAFAGEPPAGMAAAENFLQANPNLKIICGINDGGALGAYEAVMAAGRDTPDFFVGGIDAVPEAIVKIKEGGIYRASVDQDPKGMGEKCVELAIKAIRGEAFEKDYLVKLVPVNKTNVANY